MMSGIATEVVDYLLFVDEAPLADRIQGTSTFAQRFAAIGPRDAKGRSLHELDLTRRLLRYPCSYQIYSDAFEALPPSAKDPIYRRMWQVLSGDERGERYRSALSLAGSAGDCRNPEGHEARSARVLPERGPITPLTTPSRAFTVVRVSGSRTAEVFMTGRSLGVSIASSSLR